MCREQHMLQSVYAQHVRAASLRILMHVTFKNLACAGNSCAPSCHDQELMCRTHLCHHAGHHVDHHVDHHQQRVSVLHVAHHTNIHRRCLNHCMLHVAWQSWQAYYQGYQYLGSQDGRTVARAAPRERTTPHYQISYSD